MYSEEGQASSSSYTLKSNLVNDDRMIVMEIFYYSVPALQWIQPWNSLTVLKWVR